MAPQELLIKDDGNLEPENRVKLRSPLATFGLILVTLGIYGIFWWYYINRELRDYGRSQGYDLGQNPTNSALAIFPGGLVIVPALMTYWNGTKRVQQAQRVAGVTVFSGWIALVIFLVVGFIYAPYLQSELNKVWRTIGTPLPGEEAPAVPDVLPPKLDPSATPVPPPPPPAPADAAPPQGDTPAS